MLVIQEQLLLRKLKMGRSLLKLSVEIKNLVSQMKLKELLNAMVESIHLETQKKIQLDH